MSRHLDKRVRDQFRCANADRIQAATNYEMCTCGCGWLTHAFYQDDLDRYLVGGCDLHPKCLHWTPVQGTP